MQVMELHISQNSVSDGATHLMTPSTTELLTYHVGANSFS